jgi:membrane protease YdiL (CAAX protease family)
MSKIKRLSLGLTVVLTVFLLQIFNGELNAILQIGKEDTNFYWSITGQILKYIIPALVVLFAFHKPSEILNELGLKKDFLKGLQFAFIFTLPMLIGYYFLGDYNNDITFVDNVLKAFKDGFREEIFFRAFLFGQLFRHVKLGFIPAVVINGLIFGLLHIYQAHSVAESLGIFGITFAGAIWFAWLYMEWEENLWLPIFTHFFMNFYWHIFSTEASAMGGFMLNLPRTLTIALSIYLTIKIVRKTRTRAINKTNLMTQEI